MAVNPKAILRVEKNPLNYISRLHFDTIKSTKTSDKIC